MVLFVFTAFIQFDKLPYCVLKTNMEFQEANNAATVKLYIATGPGNHTVLDLTTRSIFEHQNFKY